MMRAALVLLAGLLSALAACEQRAPTSDASPDGTPRAAGAPAATQATRLGALRSDATQSGFELATEPRAFEFPRDHGPHPTFRHEWWYVTGHLDAATGEHFGFELTFFRFALSPPIPPARAKPALRDTPGTVMGDVARTAPDDANGTAPSGATRRGESAAIDSALPAERSAWRARQVYMAHFAVTDLDRHQFQATERYARDALGMAGAEASPFRVWLDDWSLGTPPGESGAEGTSYWQLKASDKDYSLSLQLRPKTPPVLNGKAGLSQKSDAPGAASYYYSMPRLAVLGSVARNGKPFEVQGLAWLDREWGSGSLDASQQGWDWFALQLDDGSTLMFYALRKRSGERDSHSAGTWFAPDGATHELANDDVQIEVKDFWSSPRGGRYPARWQLRVPSLGLDVDIRPRLADQELDTSPRYWEGAATVAGTRAGEKVGGRAYVELVGYATARKR